MADILDDLRKVARLNGDTYSTPEVLGMVGRAAEEIERLREIVRQRTFWLDHQMAALVEIRDRDDRNGSLPPAYRAIIDAALTPSPTGRETT